MGPTLNDLESELSYAYLLAVAAQARASCDTATRLQDNDGIDAHVTMWAPFEDGGYLKNASLNIQLKATKQPMKLIDGHYSYSLQGIQRYNALREDTHHVGRILVVMQLPEQEADWFESSEEELSLRKCSYWVSLRGAPETTNQTAQTVYIPKSQVFNPEALRKIGATISRLQFPSYSLPAHA